MNTNSAPLRLLTEYKGSPQSVIYVEEGEKRDLLGFQLAFFFFFLFLVVILFIFSYAVSNLLLIL